MSDSYLESWIRGLLDGLDPLVAPDETALSTAEHPAFRELAAPQEPGAENRLAKMLAEIRPFSGLSRFVREDVAAKLVLQPFQANDVLLRQGDVANSLLIVLEGAVEVLVEDAGQLHSIARLGAHTVVGEIGLVTQEVRSAHVVATSAGCAGLINKDDFQQIAGRYPRLSIALSELIAERVGTLTIDVLCGKTIEGYTVRQRLGRGAMGIVYAATDSSDGRPVALKMLRHDLALDRHATERFHQEADILQQLKHVNIIRVFREFSAFGTSFIAMELCPGMSLTDLLAQLDRMPAPVARQVIGQLACGLNYAHQAGVAHRDLKPSNVMLAADGTAKLADFGLARRVACEQVELTGLGQMLGTPRYMAPEQLDGDRGDARSDLFSLGCIAYELLTGEPLFKARRLPDLLKERRTWTMPPASQIDAELDQELYGFLCRALSPEPEDRRINFSEIAGWSAPVDWPALVAKRKT
jgi:CRP-like cAMP-binding protein